MPSRLTIRRCSLLSFVVMTTGGFLTTKQWRCMFPNSSTNCGVVGRAGRLGPPETKASSRSGAGPWRAAAPAPTTLGPAARRKFDPTARMRYLRGVLPLAGRYPATSQDIVRRPGDESRPPRPRIPRPRLGRSLRDLAPARRRSDRGHPRSPPITEGPGTRIGPYKLLAADRRGRHGRRLHGRAGAAVRRQVALKIIKPGMDTDQVVARFEAERQALALMDHPNIARVLDAGATDTGPALLRHGAGQGRPDHRVLRPRPSSRPRERLELFVPVCQAIQHAHQKGIIHRDIKPSNVLVTLHDGRPVPKVIDFGVAKAIEPAADRADAVHPVRRRSIGTLEYMSPEQAEMSGPGHRHAQRHLRAGRAALRAADRHDAAGAGASCARRRTPRCCGGSRRRSRRSRARG